MAATNQYSGESYPQEKGNLSREPSYVQQNHDDNLVNQHHNNGEYNNNVGTSGQSYNNGPSEGNLLAKGTSYTPGQEEAMNTNNSMGHNGQQQLQQPQHEHIPGLPDHYTGQQPGGEYPGREYAQVLPHEQYQERVGALEHPHGLAEGQTMQTGEEITRTRTIGSEKHVLPQHQQVDEHAQQQPAQGYAGVGALGYQPQQNQEIVNDNRDLGDLQPSRSYSTYKGQTGGPLPQQHTQPIITDYSQQPMVVQEQQPVLVQGQEAYPSEHQPVLHHEKNRSLAERLVGAGPHSIVPASSATAVGTGYNHPEQTNGVPENQYGNDQRNSVLTNGPTTTVLPTNPGTSTVNRNSMPVTGGGLGAALATSGHNITPKDKKALKSEIKSEKKFEKQLAVEAKSEGTEIMNQIKLNKASMKNAEKSAKHAASFRKTYDNAIQKEIKAKKYLLKVTNEYNKIAADLERATKEMEIRQNQHIADCQTRDADNQKLVELRQNKGRNDMEREARHGDSLTKQAQAKRALSMSKRKSMI